MKVSASFNWDKTVKKKKLIVSRVFSILFTIAFIVSFFVSFDAFAASDTLSISSAVVSDKSSDVTGSINNTTNDSIQDGFVFHEINGYVTYKITLKNNHSNDLTSSMIFSSLLALYKP